MTERFLYRSATHPPMLFFATWGGWVADRHDDDGALLVTIGHPPAPGRKEKHRRGSGRGDEPEQRFRPGELINEPALRRRRHPTAGEGDELPKKIEAKIPVFKRRESLAK